MLTTLPPNQQFDLPPWQGQRSCTFTFSLINGATGENLGSITPLRSANITHDTSRTIKRQLSMQLGAVDSAAINALTDRVDVALLDGTGTSWPLGRFMFTDDTETITTNGTLSNVVLNDEMFLVDQEIIVGISAFDDSVADVVVNILAGLGVDFTIEASPYISSQAWGVGTMRGQILEALSITGDYFSPWFGNDKKLHMIRSFNPALAVPQFDWDAADQVFRSPITKVSNIITAPNRFVVISNVNVAGAAIVGTAVVPPTAPNSFAQRGFYITNTQNLQLTNAAQAQAVASNLANRNTVFETVHLNTAPDPRHDSYDVIHWQGSLWLELAWTMALTSGGVMQHTMRKAYTP